VVQGRRARRIRPFGGTKYSQATRWVLDTPMPDYAKDMVIVPASTDAVQAKIVFSALHTESPMNSNPHLPKQARLFARMHRRIAEAKMCRCLLPEINAEHIQLVKQQRKNKGWSGCIVTNPNCTSTGLTIALKVLDNEFGVKKVFATSLQALSGAGYPGVSSLDIMDNIIPNVGNGGEEEKVEWEPRKMLGKLNDGKIDMADIKFSVHTNRVAVIDGHTVCASVEVEKSVEPEIAIQALRDYARNRPRGNCLRRPNQLSRSEMKRIAHSQDSTAWQAKA
jgi:aspartate-semialdehyde dehydrogenase